MKKVVAFLLVLFIFVAPVTTLVKADVVIGDNDETVINENATILGRKLALLESFSDLSLSGVTEFTISNTNDVDSYLDYLWSEVNNAIDSLSNGEGFEEISNSLKSKYIYNLMNYRDYINNRGDYLSYTLQNPSTSLLQTFFADNVYGKIETSHYDLALDMFRALSRINSNNTPNPDPDYNSLLSQLGDFKNTAYSDTSGHFFIADESRNSWIEKRSGIYVNFPNRKNHSYVACGSNGYYSNTDTTFSSNGQKSFWVTDGILTINLDSDGNGGYNARFNGLEYAHNIISNNPSWNLFGSMYWSSNNWFVFYQIGAEEDIYSIPQARQTHFDGLSIAINHIYNYYRNIDLYVDGVLWYQSSDSIVSPTLDIDGLLKIFGNDNPIQYELQPQTQIDYDQLYQVIYNAIRNNLPISQDDINYYDSHDTIYSPTIINNYGEEEGDESDLIDTILDYAVIPKFDTAIAQPMRQALTNGVVIMQNSITNVIPNEILLILGACFFLLLFAVVINRMIK